MRIQALIKIVKAKLLLENKSIFILGIFIPPETKIPQTINNVFIPVFLNRLNDMRMMIEIFFPKVDGLTAGLFVFLVVTLSVKIGTTNLSN